MDYESVLQLAKKNSESKKEASRALPTLTPSRSADLLRKQELEKKKLLDANVARFLAKRQADERKKKNADNQKRDELLALRNQDSKARKRVKIMNKSAKSADKSAIQDAVGPNDYYIIEEPLCFMSQESLAQEEKFLKKMYNGPLEEKFSKGKSNTNKDLNGTKDRVKQALKLGDVKEKGGEKHRERKKERRDSHEVTKINDESDEEEPQRKPPRQPRPPPLNYQELLKLAEKLQQEPVKEAPREKETAPRPMTAKQREEYLCEEASRRRKEAGWKEEAYLKKIGKLPPLRESLPNSSMPRIPKKSLPETEERPSSLPRIPKHSFSSAPPSQSHKSVNQKEGPPRPQHVSRPSHIPNSVDTSMTPAERHNGSKQSSVKSNTRRESPSAPKSSFEKERAQKEKLHLNSNFDRRNTTKTSSENSQNVNKRLNREVDRKITTPREVTMSRQELSRPSVHHSRHTSSEKLDQRIPSRVPSRTPTVREEKYHSPSPASNFKSRNLISAASKAKTVRQAPQSDLKLKPNASSVVRSMPSTVGASRQSAHMNASRPAGPISRPSSYVKSRQPSNLDSRQSSEGRSRPPVDIKSRQPVGSRPRDMSPKNARPQQAINVKSRQLSPNDQPNHTDVRRKQFPPADVRSKQFPPADVRSKQFPPADVRSKQFPPADVRPKQFPPADIKERGRIKANMKRRIIESDDEYDSEDAAFIDDGPDETGEDYSKYIKEIFGYDKNRYKGIDDSDDRAMESSFQQQLKEEYTSAKIGILEDLEDIQKEKRREAMLKKKRKMV